MGVVSDRFSSLPDSVLLHILASLPFDEVIRTALLCKQWNTLWSLSNSLNFIHRPKDFVSLRKFVSFVDKSLINLHCTNNIARLHIDFPFKACFSSDVTVWVVFAITHKAKELNLILFHQGDDRYKLPKRLFSNPFLEKLNLVDCYVDKVEVVRWDSMRELRIGSMELRDDVVQKIVSGCPNLELLELNECWGFKRLELLGGKMNTLVVDGYSEPKMLLNSVLEIEAPCVKVLEMKGCFNRMRVQLMNVMNCTCAKLDFFLNPTRHEERDSYMLMGMFDSLRNVKDVMLGTWCIEVMSSWGAKNLPFSVPSCECLALRTPIQERYLPGIIRALQISSRLGTLIIHMAPPYFEFETCFIPVVNDVYSAGGRFGLSMLSRDWGYHLKKIKICGFEGMRSGQEVLFLRDLLLISANLEKMIIEWRSGHQNSMFDASDEFVAQSLLNVQRRSRNAVIQFKN